jgi:hypothetical protein
MFFIEVSMNDSFIILMFICAVNAITVDLAGHGSTSLAGILTSSFSSSEFLVLGDTILLK